MGPEDAVLIPSCRNCFDNLISTIPPYAQQPLTGEADSARAAAIKECSDKAAKISGRDYQDWQITAYRSCMFDHGQPE